MKFNLLGVLAIATVLFFSGCDTDPCKDIDCGTNGTCVEGTCVCDAGYEGTSCETLQNAKFVGSYNGSENCTSGTYTYALTISASSSSNTTIVLNNLYAGGTNTNATIGADGTSFTIASQALGSATVSGTGTISGTTVTIVYSVSVSGATDQCTVIMTRI